MTAADTLLVFDTMTLVELARYMPDGGQVRIVEALSQIGESCTVAYVGMLLSGKARQTNRKGDETLKIERIRLEAVKIAKEFYNTISTNLEQIRQDKLKKIADFVENGGGNIDALLETLTLDKQGKDEA